MQRTETNCATFLMNCRRRASVGGLWCIPLLIAVFASTSHAEIYRWDTGELIPGTEGLEPVPGAQLQNRNLSFADLSGRTLERVDFSGSNLSNASLAEANLVGTSYDGANLLDADFMQAIITEARFDNTDLSQSQLYSTASYRNRNLRGVTLNNVSGADFSAFDLAGAQFWGDVSNVDFTDAIIKGALLPFDTTREQLYSTASYQQRDLAEIGLGMRMDSLNLSQQDLRASFFSSSNFVNVDLSDANLAGAYFAGRSFSDGYRLRLDRVDLSGANLNNALLDQSGIAGRVTFDDVSFSTGTTYNQWTIFPVDFDPERYGLTLEHSQPGDLDGREGLTVTDLAYLSRRIQGEEDFMGFQFEMFDLNEDGNIDAEDLRVWVADLRQTWYGDANLDGEFNSADLVSVFQAGEYEDDIIANSTWSEGDWNADGEFDTSDLVAAFQDGGYELGPRAMAMPVPEPSSLWTLVFGFVGWVGRQRTFRDVRCCVR